MADQQSNEQLSDAEAEAQLKVESKQQQSAPAKGGARVALALAVIALLLAAAGLVLQQQRAAELGRRMDTLNAAGAEGIDGLRDSLRSEIQGAVRESRDMAGRLDLAEDRLNQLQQELATMTTADRSDWLLAEVEYLMRLAGQRVLMEDDSAGAERILQQADRLLLDLDDQRLFGVRAALAEDIAALQAAGVLDVEGIFVRLSASASRIDELPLLVPSAEAREAYQARSERVISEETGSLEEAALSVWHKLRGMVVIRHRDASVRPLLPPDQEYFLRHNLRMLLSQAQLALLRNSNALYQESLRSGLEWLGTYFPGDSPEVQAMRSALTELQAFDVGPRQPDIGRGLQSLRQYLSGRHLDTPAASNEAAKD